MNRRDFILSIGSLSASAALAHEHRFLFLNNSNYFLTQEQLLNKANAEGLSILQGLTTQTSTQLSIDLPVSLNCQYVLTDTQTQKAFAPVDIKTVNLNGSAYKVDKIIFKELEPEHTYLLKIINTKNNNPIDERFLSTVDLEKSNARIGIMSCMRNNTSSIDSMWASALAANLDYFFFIGDNVYGDAGGSSPAVLWNNYIETRVRIPFYRWKKLKPVIAIWDDHDFGINNGGGSYKHKENSLGQFNTFFAQEPIESSLARVQYNSWHFQAFQQNFIFFDNRYYRGLKNADNSKSFLNKIQIDEVDLRLKESLKPNFIFEGSPFFGRFAKDSYQASAPQELDYLLSKLKSWKMPSLFGCGDLHYSELAKIDKALLGYDTYEFVSSSMHSSRRGIAYEQPNKREQLFMQDNFLILEKTGNSQDLTWSLSCIGAGSKKQFNSELKI